MLVKPARPDRVHRSPVVGQHQIERLHRPGNSPPAQWPGLAGERGEVIWVGHLHGGIDRCSGTELARDTRHDNVLSADAHARMAQRLKGAEAVTVAAVGHAPMLDEPEAVAAIDRLLARIA